MPFVLEYHQSHEIKYWITLFRPKYWYQLSLFVICDYSSINYWCRGDSPCRLEYSRRCLIILRCRRPLLLYLFCGVLKPASSSTGRNADGWIVIAILIIWCIHRQNSILVKQIVIESSITKKDVKDTFVENNVRGNCTSLYVLQAWILRHIPQIDVLSYGIFFTKRCNKYLFAIYFKR